MKKNNLIIIAEAGVNHNGNLKIAKKLIDVASNSKADYVKFQTFTADELATKNAPKAEYQNKNLKKNLTQYNMLKKLELSLKDHIILKKYCKKKKIKFLTTPFGINSFELLKKLKLNLIKISSGDLTNIPFLRYISKNSKKNTKIILSTGMGNLKEINEAIKSLAMFNISKKNISLLHCTSNYPASNSSINMNSLKTIQKKFRIPTGYSDHSLGNTASIIAASLGAIIIEKHFTLDKKLPGPDHIASLNPSELKFFVEELRNVPIMLGSFLKKTQKEELNVKKIARKSLVAKIKINKGELFSNKNIDIKRPGTGMSPRKLYNLINKKSKNNYKKDQLIKE
jgi:N,N'-diacetyllegionaminate synthase